MSLLSFFFAAAGIKRKAYNGKSWQVFALTSVMVCMAPQSGFFTVTFLGLRFYSLASDREINGSLSTQVTNTSAIILSWPSNLVCLFFFCFSLNVWSNLCSLLESFWLGPALLSTGTVYFREKIYNIKIIRFACVIRDSSTAQEFADAVKPFLFSLVALVSYSYFAFMMSHSYDCLYEEEKLAWQGRPLYFSTDGLKVWRYCTLCMQPLFRSCRSISRGYVGVF